jgi:ERCC4-type nuclease
MRTYTLQETLDIITRLHDRLFKDINDFFPINNIKHIQDSREKIDCNENIDCREKIDCNENIDCREKIDSNENIVCREKIDSSEDNNLYLQSIKKCKKDNITVKLWNQMCYMNIPGISSSIATKITEVYPTLKSLFKGYEKCSTDMEKELLLSLIVLTKTEKQTRRIGNVISKRVYEFLEKE